MFKTSGEAVLTVPKADFDEVVFEAFKAAADEKGIVDMMQSAMDPVSYNEYFCEAENVSDFMSLFKTFLREKIINFVSACFGCIEKHIKIVVTMKMPVSILNIIVMAFSDDILLFDGKSHLWTADIVIDNNVAGIEFSSSN